MSTEQEAVAQRRDNVGGGAGPGELSLELVMGAIGSALGALRENRRRLKAQDASIPETLEATMQACELALTATRAVLTLASTQVACIEAIRNWVDDSRRLQEALGKRLEVLSKT